MRKYIAIFALLAGLLVLRADAPPAEAATWNQTDIDDVKNKVTNIESTVNTLLNSRMDGPSGLFVRTSNLPTKLANLQTSVDNVPEVVDNMREGRSKVTQDMFDAIDDAITVLQEEVTEERNGLNAFVGPSGDCSSAECIQFRTDISDLLANMQNLSNTLVEVDPGVGVNAQVDLARLRNIIQNLPASGLYPMYRATNRDNDLFGSGIVQLLSDLDSDIRSIAPAVRSTSSRPERCDFIMQDPQQFESIIIRIDNGGTAVETVGKLLKAWGEHRNVNFKIGIHGYPGIVVNSQRLKTVGGLSETVGTATWKIAKIANNRLSLCELLAGNQQIVNGQAGCEVEITSNGHKGKIFEFFILTTEQGERVDPSMIDVWVGSDAVAPIGGTPMGVIPGVQRVELDKKAIPSGKGAPLTVEAEVSGNTCSAIEVVKLGDDDD